MESGRSAWKNGRCTIRGVAWCILVSIDWSISHRAISVYRKLSRLTSRFAAHHFKKIINVVVIIVVVVVVVVVLFCFYCYCRNAMWRNGFKTNINISYMCTHMYHTIQHFFNFLTEIKEKGIIYITSSRRVLIQVMNRRTLSRAHAVSCLSFLHIYLY